MAKLRVSEIEDFEKCFPVSTAIMGLEAIREIVSSRVNDERYLLFEETPPDDLYHLREPLFLHDLMHLEMTREVVSKRQLPGLYSDSDNFQLNPALEILHSSWKIANSLDGCNGRRPLMPVRGEEYCLVWRHPETGQTRVEEAAESDLLALKLVSEDISLKKALETYSDNKLVIINALYSAARKGLLLRPASRIVRQSGISDKNNMGSDFLTASTFSLQWHITLACDLNCKHCYDRTKRSSMTLEQGIKVLDGLKEFCERKKVRPDVCLSGGNPFLYPGFYELYEAATERGIAISILANPVSREKVEKMLEIQVPHHFQVSLEGLREHNDDIRGKGSYSSVIEFLGILRDLKISNGIMLTLTRSNMDQVIPLAQKLRGHVDTFTFNRLAQVGEGANLESPGIDEYEEFLHEYIEASENNPVMGLKDNLINIIRHRNGQKLFGGCTGYGCGAAFNFLALLPDGEVHACRKFPSLLGNIKDNTLLELYDSELARRYRRGSSACDDCEINHACGGCLAVAYGHGLDIFNDKDPHCFMRP